jgi:hypothetical protein
MPCFLRSYMTIFYLQQLQMLPALRELVPPALMRQPDQRLLQVCNLIACLLLAV